MLNRGKQIKQWWFITDNGKLALSVRYSALLLKLAKGKYAVELASEKALLPTLEIIKTAVLAGALGTAIEIAASKLSDGFSR
jgi:hypothetical protein